MSEGTATDGAPTGRLFRSLRAEGDAAQAAVPALTLDQAVTLRTVTLGDSTFGAPTTPSAGSAATPTNAAVAASAAVAAPAPANAAGAAPANAEVAAPAPTNAAVAAADAEAMPSPVEEVTSTPSSGGTTYIGGVGGRRGAHAAPGIRASGVWMVVIGVTVIVAFADVVAVGTINWITGLALVAASIYGAIMVRMADWPIAVIAPPLAMFLAVITAGQLALGPVTDLVVNEALMIVITLGNNVVTIFGATLAALVIVLIRRSRARSD